MGRSGLISRRELQSIASVYKLTNSQQSQKDGNICIVEIRRTPKDPWYVENVMTEKFGEALLGTSLALDIADKNIKVPLLFSPHIHICSCVHSLTLRSAILPEP